MDIVDRIYYLLHEKRLSAKSLADYAGISTGNVSDWKARKSKPGINALPKIAEYLEVSLDYLLTGEEPMPKELDAEQRELIKLYDALSEVQRAEMRGYLKGLAAGTK